MRKFPIIMRKNMKNTFLCFSCLHFKEKTSETLTNLHQLIG
jgi:hypothetical protein